MSERKEIREFLLAFADDEHLMGQQHTEWIGVAPFLEEDLAFSSIGQDELGHAALLYELVLELDGIEPTDEAVDRLAFGRPSGDYRCCHLVEYTTGGWAEALVRHWIYDTFEEMRWVLAGGSTLPKLASIARRAQREEAFHRRHADALLDKLLVVPEAQSRIAEALEVIAHLVPGLCEATAGEASAIAAGVTAGPTADLYPLLARAIAKRFGNSVGVDTGEAARFGDSAAGGSVGTDETVGFGNSAAGELAAATNQDRRTRRSDSFGPLMARMREVLDYDPAAVW